MHACQFPDALPWQIQSWAGGGARASMTPLPIWLSTQGIFVQSTKRRSWLDVILRLAPAPITISGCLDACTRAARLGHEEFYPCLVWKPSATSI